MDYASTWPVAVIMGVLFIIAATPLMRAADSPPIEARSRLNGLDGLRGFLALAVFYSHTIIYHQYLLTGVWHTTQFPFFTMLGQGGVSVFFMITGYLFWSQLVAKAGKPSWINLYTGRAFRILPLYWFSVSLVLIEVFLHTGFRLQESLPRLGGELSYWLVGGLRPEVPINGYGDASVLIAGVTWTLGYEWKFYASLIILSFLARDPKVRVIAPMVGLAVMLAWLVLQGQGGGRQVGVLIYALLFLCGICVATLSAATRRLELCGTAGSVVFLSLLATVWIFSSTILSVGPIIILSICFFLVISGVTVFGLLSCRAARRLGNISFGIYLLQGPVLAGSFLLPGVRAVALGSPIGHWMVMTADGIVLVILATAAHALVERPGIALGKSVALRLNRVWPGTKPLEATRAVGSRAP